MLQRGKLTAERQEEKERGRVGEGEYAHASINPRQRSPPRPLSPSVFLLLGALSASLRLNSPPPVYQPQSVFHDFIVPSALPLTSRLPSGLKLRQ